MHFLSSVFITSIGMQSTRIQAISSYNQGLSNWEAMQSGAIVVGGIVALLIVLKLVVNAIKAKEEKQRRIRKQKKASQSASKARAASASTRRSLRKHR